MHKKYQLLICFSLFILFSIFANASLYEKKCNQKSGLEQLDMVCQNGIGSAIYDVGQLWFDKNQYVERMRRQEKEFLVRLKLEKLNYLKVNYNQLLSYFWQKDKIKNSNFYCSKEYDINEKSFNSLPKKRKDELTDDNERINTIQRRMELTRNLIIYQRALNEIDSKINELTSSCARAAPFGGVNLQYIPSCNNLYENGQKLRLAKYAILNSYPILDSDSWKEGIEKNRTIFNKSSGSEVAENEIGFVELHLVDSALIEIQDNLLEEAQETCNQTTQDLVGNDFIAQKALNGDSLYSYIYCKEYDINEGTDILKTTGLVAGSVVAVAAAPLSGGSSLLGLSSTIIGGGAIALDIGIAINDIDNYSDLKRQFLSNITNENGQLATYEDKKSAYTHALLSSVLAGTGAIGESIGIVRTFKARKAIKLTDDTKAIIPKVATPTPSPQVAISEKAWQHVNGVIDSNTKKLRGGMHTHEGVEQFVKTTGHQPIEDITLLNGVRRVKFEREAFTRDAWKLTETASRSGNGATGVKSIFPSNWSKEKIAEAARSISTEKNKLVSYKSGDTMYEGVYDGVRIRVAYANDELITIYPTWIQ